MPAPKYGPSGEIAFIGILKWSSVILNFQVDWIS